MITKQINNYTRIVSVELKKITKAGIFLSDMLTPMQWYNKQVDKPSLVFNAPFFTWSDDGKFVPCHTLKVDGKLLKKESLFFGMGIKDNAFYLGNIDTLECDDFISGKPVITQNGNNMVTQGWANTLKDIAGYEPRTIFGWNGTQASLIMVDGRQTGKYGIDLMSMPKLCLDNGLDNSINLDGGYSSMGILNGEYFNSPDLTKARGTYAVMAIWEEKEMTEWKEPNWNWIWTKYAQVDKDGKVKVQNNDYGIAKMNAEKDGYAVWEKATKKRVYPEEVLQNVTETEKPVISEPINAEKVFLESIKKMIDERLNNLNG